MVEIALGIYINHRLSITVRWRRVVCSDQRTWDLPIYRCCPRQSQQHDTMKDFKSTRSCLHRGENPLESRITVSECHCLHCFSSHNSHCNRIRRVCLDLSARSRVQLCCSEMRTSRHSTSIRGATWYDEQTFELRY